MIIIVISGGGCAVRRATQKVHDWKILMQALADATTMGEQVSHDGARGKNMLLGVEALSGSASSCTHG